MDTLHAIKNILIEHNIEGVNEKTDHSRNMRNQFFVTQKFSINFRKKCFTSNL